MSPCLIIWEKSQIFAARKDVVIHYLRSWSCIMAIMSGRYGYREIARFLKANREQLVKALDLKRTQMPSHVTIRT